MACTGLPFSGWSVAVLPLSIGANIMADTSRTVFISYRRSVSSFVARAVFENLRANGYDVFMDVESIDSGTFDTIILNQIAARAHFVVILTPSSVQRCKNPDDWLRREIEEAIRLQRNIVPILVEDFGFDGARDCLTGVLAELPRYNGLRLPHDFFNESMERLRNRFLRQAVPDIMASIPPEEQAVVQAKIAEAAAKPVPTPVELISEQYFDRAYCKAEEQDYEGAIADYTEAIRLKSDLAVAYSHRGAVYREKGQHEQAIADYTEAIRLRPGDALAYHCRGWTYYIMGQYDEAIADYTESIRLRPDDPDAFGGRGAAYKGKGQHQQAIADYTEAIRLNPNYASGYRDRGAVYKERGHHEQAIVDDMEALRLNPDCGLAYSNLRASLSQLGLAKWWMPREHLLRLGRLVVESVRK
jgi:tetratricopeptide (TPR) repeat protein